MSIAANLKRAAGKALRGVRSSEGKLVMHKLGADRLPRIVVESNAFPDGARMPARHSHTEGDSISPELHWSAIPPEAKELVLVVEDPDAPTPQPFVHWLVYGIPAHVTQIGEGIREATPLHGARQGKTTTRKEGFDGPAPPPGHGEHHYHFQLFAIDKEVELPTGAGRDDLIDEIEGHVVAAGELVGIYERS